MPKRQVILHYHLFKNAGTSIDNILKKSFAAEWENYDKPNSNEKISAAEMERFILSRPDLKAVSSHQVVPPQPDKELEIFPIIFFRHPIERIRSCYLFETQKQLGLESPSMSLRDYIEQKFTIHRGSNIEEFHSTTIANLGYNAKNMSKSLSDNEILERAINFVDSLPCYGIVDFFEESLKRYHCLMSKSFPQFKPFIVRANTTQDASISLQQRLDIIRDEIGNELYLTVQQRNAIDLALYDHALKLFQNPYTYQR